MQTPRLYKHNVSHQIPVSHFIGNDYRHDALRYQFRDKLCTIKGFNLNIKVMLSLHKLYKRKRANICFIRLKMRLYMDYYRIINNYIYFTLREQHHGVYAIVTLYYSNK